MSFKENLLKKIEVDNLAAKVIGSIGPLESGRKVDKAAMRALLEMAAYTHRKERDLELYLEDEKAAKGYILVLDNDLTIYDTTVEDVVIRKSPYVKDMVSIRNIFRILNDKDVVVSKKDASVEHIQKICISNIDLSYDADDIADIAIDGVASLESRYADGVIEVIDMFAELLGYRPPPKNFSIRHHHIRGSLEEKEQGNVLFGPTVIYSLADNTIDIIDTPISASDTDQMQRFRRIASHEEKAAISGGDSFKYLQEAVLKANMPHPADE